MQNQTIMADKKRYSDEELEEFKAIINEMNNKYGIDKKLVVTTMQ